MMNIMVGYHGGLVMKWYAREFKPCSSCEEELRLRKERCNLQQWFMQE
jgi:hypothetical protein